MFKLETTFVFQFYISLVHELLLDSGPSSLSSKSVHGNETLKSKSYYHPDVHINSTKLSSCQLKKSKIGHAKILARSSASRHLAFSVIFKHFRPRAMASDIFCHF